MNAQRPAINVATPPGGWPPPWPAVAGLADALPAANWTLVGGLMTQLHAVHRGLGIVRPTNDVDIVLHIETRRGVPAATTAALEGLGYRLQSAADPRNNTAHRFVRGASTIDLIAGVDRKDQIDVLIADHPAPKVVERLGGREMVRVEGGTQALRRTINANIKVAGEAAVISVPRPLGALILKAAAYTTDSRDRDRHVYDAAILLASIDDPFAEREDFTGSDRRRIASLAKELSPEHPAWRTLSHRHRGQAEATLTILSEPV